MCWFSAPQYVCIACGCVIRTYALCCIYFSAFLSLFLSSSSSCTRDKSLVSSLLFAVRCFASLAAYAPLYEMRVCAFLHTYANLLKY